MTMTLLNALGDEDDALPQSVDARAAAAAAPAAMAPPVAAPLQALPAMPVLAIDYERAVQPPEARIVWESHPDGETFTDPFSVWRTLLGLGQWVLLVLFMLVQVALFHVQVQREVALHPLAVIAPCVLGGWCLFRIACELVGCGKPWIVSVRAGVLSLTRPTIGGMRTWKWPVTKVKQIDVAIGSSTQHASRSLRIRFHRGRRISFFRCKSRHEGVWIAHRLAAAMDLPESAVH
jgi:hypothetical protein